MAMEANSSDPHGLHDWHSDGYVDAWVAKDLTRDDDRAAWVKRLADLLPFPADQPIRVLDIGAGYGAVSRAVLDAYPSATVVLHDFSEPMFRHARENLVDAADRISFVAGDLRDPAWAEATDGEFDAVVSSIAIHNVRDSAIVRRVYADVRGLVGPRGCFYNLDHVLPSGPLSARALGSAPASYPSGDERELPTLLSQVRWVTEAGFDEADCLFRVGRQALIAGFVA